MMNLKIFFLFVLSSDFVYKLVARVGDHWDYEDNGPLTWSQTFLDCAGVRQSPINLEYFNIVNRKFPSFLFSPNFTSNLLFNLTNNGHSVVGELAAQTSPSIILQLAGGGLPGIFQFTNFHLHWGDSLSEGSEHTINGLHGAGEAHFVFTNVITKQLAVLGFFLVASADQQQSAWGSYVDNAVTLIHDNTQVQFMTNLMQLMKTENNFQDFWRYDGSLTTPACTEGVIWTVFNSHIQFSYDKLRALSQNVLRKNFRPVQLRYNRIIYHSIPSGASGCFRWCFFWPVLLLMSFLIRMTSTF